jgi:hypothetical protein
MSKHNTGLYGTKKKNKSENRKIVKSTIFYSSLASHMIASLKTIHINQETIVIKYSVL